VNDLPYGDPFPACLGQRWKKRRSEKVEKKRKGIKVVPGHVEIGVSKAKSSPHDGNQRKRRYGTCYVAVSRGDFPRSAAPKGVDLPEGTTRQREPVLQRKDKFKVHGEESGRIQMTETTGGFGSGSSDRQALKVNQKIPKDDHRPVTRKAPWLIAGEGRQGVEGGRRIDLTPRRGPFCDGDENSTHVDSSFRQTVILDASREEEQGGGGKRERVKAAQRPNVCEPPADGSPWRGTWSFQSKRKNQKWKRSMGILAKPNSLAGLWTNPPATSTL